MQSDLKIEQGKARKPSFCGIHSLGGRLEGPEGTKYRVSRLRCKSWTCPTCGKKRARRLRKAICEQGQVHSLDRFLTLTMDPAKGTAGESLERIKEVWAKFRVYLAREYGKGAVKYLWVMEQQKNGYAHLHILLNVYIPQEWVKEAWDGLGGGRIVFITRANVRKAGHYLAKYLTKAFDGGLKRGQRRYGSSRVVKLGRGAGEKVGVWIMVKVPLEVLRQRVTEGVLQEYRSVEGVLEGFESLKAPLYIPQTKGVKPQTGGVKG